jgi:copper resistance protein D
MLENGLVAARFFHLVCAIILFGGTAFVLYSRLDVGRSERLEPLPGILATAAFGLCLSGLAWFVLTAANMAGGLRDALDRETLSSLLWETSFGLVWSVRAPLMLIIFFAMLWWRRMSGLSRRGTALVACVAATLLASLAGVGHTQVDEGFLAGLHVTADAVHLLASGAWVGGLIPLFFFLAPDRTGQVSNDEAVHILLRFSGMGYVAVAALIGSGLMNCWFLLGSPSHLINTTYGHLLLAKLGLFGLMLLLALSNRFWLVPTIAQSKTESGSKRLLARLRRQVGGELLLGLFVVGAVSMLGMLSPAIHGS